MRVPVSEANDLNFLLYEPRRCIETPLLWLTKIFLLLHGRELKEETTFGPDDSAVLIDHEETTTVVPVQLGLETPGRLGGARSRGYGPEASYNRALVLATPDDTSNYRRCSLLKLVNLDYIQHFSYGARGFMRVPVSEANDLNYLLCRCDETCYANRLGNNEIKAMTQIGLNSVTKNRAPY